MADALGLALLLAGAAGGAMPLGALLARYGRIRRRWLREEVRHSVTAFGGGALLSAIALVLVPEGSERLPGWAAVAAFGAGGVVFFYADWQMEARGGRFAILMAMLLDFLPEAMALGALIATEAPAAILLAALIFLQNLPEGFAAHDEIRASTRMGSRRIILLFGLLALGGPLCAAAGLLVLAAQPGLLGAIMLFAAGGILYLIFQDLAPAARLERAWVPSLGAVGGFMLGLAGHLWLA